MQQKWRYPTFFVVWVRDVLGLWNIHLISEGLDDVWGEFAIQQSTTQQYELWGTSFDVIFLGQRGFLLNESHRAQAWISKYVSRFVVFLSVSLEFWWMSKWSFLKISPIPHISCLLPPIIGVEKGSLIPFGHGLSSGAGCWFWGGCVSTYPPKGWLHSSLGHHTHPSVPRWQTGSPKDVAISIVWWPVRDWLHNNYKWEMLEKTSQPNKHVLQDPGFSKIWQVQQMHHPETTGSPSPSSFLTKKHPKFIHTKKTPTRMPSSTSWSILEPSWVSLRRKNSLSSWNFWSAASLWRKIRANDSGGDFWVRGNGLLEGMVCWIKDVVKKIQGNIERLLTYYLHLIISEEYLWMKAI